MAKLTSTLELTLLDRVSARAKAVNAALLGIQRHTSMVSNSLRGIMAFGATYLGVTQGLKHTIGAAMSFESAFADVRKVVDATDEQLENMARSIRKLSTVVPATANDLAALYAAGAESGIATNEINQFAEMASRVGVAFDISMGEAGEALAKLKTQLGLSLTETGDLADAMNHLSNNMASKASDIQAFMLRVGALAEMGGFAKEEIAALGSAMIAAGAQPEVAATAMQNVVKAMTRGKFAKAGQKAAAKALGLDLPAIAKQMQKDAPGAVKKVLTAISKAPKDQHIALLSEFFGDEAKAFAPLVGNIELLEQALAAVADKSKYAGSAFKEYVERAKTTGNVLQLLQNKLAEVGRSIGDSWLPTVKEVALGIGDILDTLGSRATIFDQLKTAIKGFTNGLGLNGGIREAINDLGDLLLGVDNGSEAADKLGRIFARFQQYGQQIKAFADGVDEGIRRFEKAFHLKDGTVGDTISKIAGWGATLGAASIGIGLAASAISALGRALWVLSGGALVVGGVKGIKGIFDAVTKVPTAGAVGAAAGAANAGGKVVTKPGVVPTALNKLAGEWDKLGKWGKGLVVLQAISGAFDAVKNSTQSGMFDNINDARSFADSMTKFLFGEDIAKDRFAATPVDDPNTIPAGAGWAKLMGWIDYINDRLTKPAEKLQPSVNQQLQIQSSEFPGKAKDDFDIGRPRVVTIDAGSIAAMIQPAGVQQVHVVNQAIPNVNVNAPITVNGVADAKAAASSAAQQLGSKVKEAVEAAYSD